MTQRKDAKIRAAYGDVVVASPSDCGCGSPSCPQLHGITLQPKAAQDAPPAPRSRESERAAVVAKFGECCMGADPLCAAECLVVKAMRKSPAHEALIALVQKWREEASQCVRWGMLQSIRYEAIEKCANELEAALKGAQ